MKYDARHRTDLYKPLRKYNRPERLLPNGTETYQMEDIRRCIRIFQDIMVEGSEAALVRGPDDGPFSDEHLSKAQLDFETIFSELTGHTLTQVTLALAEVLRLREELGVPFEVVLRSEKEGRDRLMNLDIPV